MEITVLKSRSIPLQGGTPPMPVSLDDVAMISGAVAAEQSPHVDRITVASTCAESHRVELLVVLGQSPYEQHRLMLNLSRKEPAGFERQLRAKLTEARRQFPPTLA
jgi:hypothetical protein